MLRLLSALSASARTDLKTKKLLSLTTLHTSKKLAPNSFFLLLSLPSPTIFPFFFSSSPLSPLFLPPTTTHATADGDLCRRRGQADPPRLSAALRDAARRREEPQAQRLVGRPGLQPGGAFVLEVPLKLLLGERECARESGKREKKNLRGRKKTHFFFSFSFPKKRKTNVTHRSSSSAPSPAPRSSTACSVSATSRPPASTAA